ncbi:MAG: PQQ-dependent sugar dehydrogenase [Pyrinomonadaceae bacterium]|nr:PQQ-dependent sugar dehydrogenase [Pyrinomonadaceae bacterium]
MMVWLCAVILGGQNNYMQAQTPAPSPPTMLDARLGVRAVVTGLNQPTTMAFLGANDILVLEKATGRVQRVVNGVIQGTVLDLAVNAGSERGLLGIALHPEFATNGFVYLYWTESATGADTNNLADLGSIWFSLEPLLGNRVDRFRWNGTSLAFDRNITRFRHYQADPGQPLRGNHDGGIIRFGPDAKLYIIVGDTGRRGQMQNLVSGPTLTGLGPTVPDDQFGGPAPDNAHFTGVIVRLNDDGTSPADNPYFALGASVGGEVGANLQRIFVHGIRNSFGMAFDPIEGGLWTQENTDDAFDEINRWEAGMNGGWAQFMGPIARIAEFKSIELTIPPSGGLPGAQLQQIRWPADRIADTSDEALARLFLPPGSRYSEPEFSWKYAVAPGALGFLSGAALGEEYTGDMFVGAATAPPNPGSLAGGYLFRFNLTTDRQAIAVSDPLLEDRVADNTAKFSITESESLLIGRDFGISTDIQTGPNGNLYVVSLSRGTVYEIFLR